MLPAAFLLLFLALLVTAFFLPPARKRRALWAAVVVGCSGLFLFSGRLTFYHALPLLFVAVLLPPPWRQRVLWLFVCLLGIPMLLGILFIGGLFVNQALPNLPKVAKRTCPPGTVILQGTSLSRKDSILTVRYREDGNLPTDSSHFDTVEFLGRYATTRGNGFNPGQVFLEVHAKDGRGWMDGLSYGLYMHGREAPNPLSNCLDSAQLKWEHTGMLPASHPWVQDPPTAP